MLNGHVRSPRKCEEWSFPQQIGYGGRVVTLSLPTSEIGVLFAARPQIGKAGTRVVTEINSHRDKRSSEIMTQKRLKGLNNNITQTKWYDKYCLR